MYYMERHTWVYSCRYVQGYLHVCTYTRPQVCTHKKRVHAPNIQSKTMKMLLGFFLLGTPDSLNITPLLRVVLKG